MVEGNASRPTPERDPYSRVEYRRLIAWEDRIRREEPFLRELLARAPDPSVLDLGCGTGEHVAHLARQGVRAVGVDSSASMLEKAREHEARGEGRFVLGDALEVDLLLDREPRFGLTLCLGNMLPHLESREQLARCAAAAARMLLTGGLFLIQIVNYRRILECGVRHLPVNLRPGEHPEEEVIFLRLLRSLPDGRMLFCPTTLVLDATLEEPVRLQASRRVVLQPWMDTDLQEVLEETGFQVQLLGSMTGDPYEPRSSTDLVVLGCRPGGTAGLS